MKLDPKNGIDKLLFGMKASDVINIYGAPDREFDDEENNKIFLYNDLKLRLTFYEDEDYKLGYFICAHDELTFLNLNITGVNVTDLISKLENKGITKWENEDFDSITNYFNESNWLTLQAEFGLVNRVEIGAIFDNNDEMQFKFKG